MSAAPLIPDDLVRDEWTNALAAVSDPAPTRDDILEACDDAAAEIEQSVKAALRCGGKVSARLARRVVCLRAPVQKARAQ